MNPKTVKVSMVSVCTRDVKPYVRVKFIASQLYHDKKINMRIGSDEFSRRKSAYYENKNFTSP